MAEAGLGGSVQGDKSVGAGFASAQAGNKAASAGLVGDPSLLKLLIEEAF